MRGAPLGWLGWGLATVALLAPGCTTDDEGVGADVVADTQVGVSCQHDDDDEADKATTLPPEGATGQLCPVEDIDWYRVVTGADHHLMTITLAMDGELSPVEPSYIVWSEGDDGAPDTVVASTPPERIGYPLNEVHCVAPGTYLVAVRDDGDNAQDFRRSYSFNVTSAADPDPAEPNDDQDGATTLRKGSAADGAVACAGDTDWYAFDVAQGEVVQLRLELGVARFEPQLRLIDDAGELVATRANPSARVVATTLDLEAVLPRAGRYYAVVSDDDGRHADPDVSYTLTLSTTIDSDPNEPNPHPDVATSLSGRSIACGSAWSAWITRDGTISAPGDNDWFRLPLEGCGGPPGVIEAEVTMQDGGLSAAERWALAQKVQLALTVVREHEASPCATDLSCQALTKSCSSNWDCSGLFNACRPDGFCAGAGVCLPEGGCGANVIQRQYLAPAQPSDPAAAGPPPPQIVRVSAPLTGEDVVYLRVADFQSNGGDAAAAYQLRVRVRRDPDAHEPSNVYAPTILSDFPTGVQTRAAVDVPVHDCTGLEPDCCEAGGWIEGALSYENDMDWYRYAHPCPGEDCNLRMVYEFDSGPVDFVLSVYRGNSLWFGGVAGASGEAPQQAAISGSYGGGGACFYAYQGHQGTPFNYHVAIRDFADTRDWSADQGYRFCLEKVSTACEAPCVVYENGCGQP